MSAKHQNPLIGDDPAETFGRVDGMIGLLRMVDFSGQTGVMSEDAEVALQRIFDLMQDALRHETNRERKHHAAAAGFKAG